MPGQVLPQNSWSIRKPPDSVRRANVHPGLRQSEAHPTLLTPRPGSFPTPSCLPAVRGPLGLPRCLLQSQEGGRWPGPWPVLTAWASVSDQLLRRHHLRVRRRGGRPLPVCHRGRRRGQHSHDRRLGERPGIPFPLGGPGRCPQANRGPSESTEVLVTPVLGH